MAADLVTLVIDALINVNTQTTEKDVSPTVDVLRKTATSSTDVTYPKVKFNNHIGFIYFIRQRKKPISVSNEVK